MRTIRRDAEIHDVEGGWFRARWHFSFDDYRDPENDSFGAMRVFNDDRLVPGAVWPLHPHRDVEGLTYVVEGLFGHEDNVGGPFGPLPAGSVQRMTLGSGARHSELNASKTEPMRFIQIWILPDAPSLPPGVEQRVYTKADRSNRLLRVFAPMAEASGADGPDAAGESDGALASDGASTPMAGASSADGPDAAGGSDGAPASVGAPAPDGPPPHRALASVGTPAPDGPPPDSDGSPAPDGSPPDGAPDSDGLPAPVGLHQDASIYVAALDAGVDVRHGISDGRGVYLYVIDGRVTIDGSADAASVAPDDLGTGDAAKVTDELGTGDAAKVTDERHLTIRADAASELILVDVPMRFESVGAWRGRT